MLIYQLNNDKKILFLLKMKQTIIERFSIISKKKTKSYNTNYIYKI
jgi:hypothetical protein